MGLLCAWLGSLVWGLGCASGGAAERPAAEHEPGVRELFSAATSIQDAWMHLPLKGFTEYRLVAVGDEVAIHARGRRSASGLIRPIRLDAARCPWLEWSWQVAELQPDADIRKRDQDDVAASIFLLFGDPGGLDDPKPVPTLRYVWTSRHTPQGSIVDSPYLSGIVQSLVVESGSAKLGHFVTERRNIAADFEHAFGHPPEEEASAIVLFTDNDQTEEDVSSYYAWARAICAD